MRITFVNRLAGILRGGGETFDLEAARALQRLGHEVRFVIGRRWLRHDRPLDEFPVTVVRTPYLRSIMYRFDDHPLRILRALSYHAMCLDLDWFERAAYRAIARSELAAWTEVFQINGLPRLGAWLRQRLGSPAVIVWHGPPYGTSGAWNRRCSGTFAFGDSLAAVRKDADPRAWEIRPGVDTERFHPAPHGDLRARHEIPQAAVVCLFVGRMIPVKELPLLLRAFARARTEAPHLFLLLAGDGPARAGLEAMLPPLGLADAVRFAGRQEGPGLVEQYNLADMFLLASSFENLPFVMLEAMACGLPVIATRVGAVPGLLGSEAGILIEPRNEEQLAHAILRLARDADLRRALGESARRRIMAKGYRWTDTAAAMVELYRSCLGAGR